jgi:hypothetical protein
VTPQATNKWPATVPKAAAGGRWKFAPLHLTSLQKVVYQEGRPAGPGAAAGSEVPMAEMSPAVCGGGSGMQGMGWAGRVPGGQSSTLVHGPTTRPNSSGFGGWWINQLADR